MAFAKRIVAKPESSDRQSAANALSAMGYVLNAFAATPYAATKLIPAPPQPDNAVPMSPAALADSCAIWCRAWGIRPPLSISLRYHAARHGRGVTSGSATHSHRLCENSASGLLRQGFRAAMMAQGSTCGKQRRG